MSKRFGCTVSPLEPFQDVEFSFFVISLLSLQFLKTVLKQLLNGRWIMVVLNFVG